MRKISFSFLSVYTLKETGEKPNRKPYLLPDGFRNPNRHLKSRTLKIYAQKPQGNCTFMNLASVQKGLTLRQDPTVSISIPG
jgi:hypothetical protein